MKRPVFYVIAVLSFFVSNAAADIISGAVTDSASGKALYHVKVGIDSTHFILTDSLGNFSYNTDGNVGTTSGPKVVSWNPSRETFFFPANSGDFSVKIRNSRGVLVRDFTSKNLSAEGSRFSLSALPQGIYMASIYCGGKTTVQKIMNIGGGSSLLFKASSETEKTGLGKSSAILATTTLNFQKPTYYKAAKSFTGSQSNVAIKLREDFSLSRHDFLTAAEWQCNNGNCEDSQKMYLVRGGKIVGIYTEPNKCEFDDVWMLSDGSITMSLRYGARKIKSMQDTTTTWYIYENIQTMGEIHVVQPLSLDKVFVLVNQGTSKLAMIINTQTRDTLKKWFVPAGTGTGFHGDLRQARITRDGTLAVAHFDLNKISEYDTASMQEIWSYSGSWAWAMVKLRNGNFLISGDGNGYVREIDRATKATVWDLDVKNLPGVTFGKYIQGIQRLANGNTMVTNNEGNPAIFEVNPAKQVVWSVPKSVISTSSAIQILDEEGIPERAGDLMR